MEGVRQQEAAPGKHPLKQLSDTLFALGGDSITNAPAPLQDPAGRFESSRICQICGSPQEELWGGGGPRDNQIVCRCFPEPPQGSTVAKKNSLLTGRNLEQDPAHKEEPSCCS